MITANIHRDENDEVGVTCQLLTVPRIGETISIPDGKGVERDLKVKGINHWCRELGGQIIQSEIAIFCTPTRTIN
jgi:hypothetical protein